MRDSKPTVLIVEDEDGVRNLIVTILRLSGFDAVPCADAVEALDYFAVHGHYIQLLVTDVNLGPDQGGIELAQGLRDAFPQLRVLYVSGLVDEGPVSAEVNSGRAAFLPKPFTPKTLIDKTRGILAGTYRSEALPMPRDRATS
jgi:DNA-binding response OmpR family regulator